MRIKVAALQLRAYDVLHAKEALEHVLAMMDAAAAAGPDVMVLPECVYPGYFLGWRGDVAAATADLAEALAAFCHKAREHRVYLVAGLAERVAALVRSLRAGLGGAGQVVRAHPDRDHFGRRRGGYEPLGL